MVFQWFPMVANHWSNDGMVTIHRSGLLHCQIFTNSSGFSKSNWISGEKREGKDAANSSHIPSYNLVYLNDETCFSFSVHLSCKLQILQVPKDFARWDRRDCSRAMASRPGTSSHFRIDVSILLFDTFCQIQLNHLQIVRPQCCLLSEVGAPKSELSYEFLNWLSKPSPTTLANSLSFTNILSWLWKILSWWWKRESDAVGETPLEDTSRYSQLLLGLLRFP